MRVKLNSTINLTPMPGSSFDEAFAEMKNLERMGIDTRRVTITVNDMTFLAGIFDTFESFKTHIEAIMSGDKKRILATIPSSDEADIARDLACANQYLEANGFETFTREHGISGRII